MLRKDQLKPGAPGATADAAEVARFQALAQEWWKPDGAFKVVHAFNAARVAHLGRLLPRLLHRDASAARPLAGVRLLDVGCGAGLVAEPMARLGASVTGIDAAARNVAIAAGHAKGAGLDIRYLHALPEVQAATGETYDVVLTLEVVEHVADVPAFLSACASLVAPNGVLVVGTLNRTAKSFALAIVGAEYILRWLPKGTHDWRRFVSPAELDEHLTPHQLAPAGVDGVVLNPLTGVWRIDQDASVNYLKAFVKKL